MIVKILYKMNTYFMYKASRTWQNNSNPNKIVEGNPDLRPDYSHQLNVSYNHWKGLTGSYIWSNLSYRRVMNPFSNEITYDNFGRTISKTVNMDSSANEFASLYVGGKIPIGNTPLGINLNNSSVFNLTVVRWAFVVS